MVKVSIVVPMYGVEKYLRQCLDSILNQTFVDYEVILIDDESPDNSKAIAQEYCDRYSDKFRLISQKNRGLAGARNTGILNSNGIYVAFLDSDDVYLPNKLAYHVDHLDNNPEVGLSYSWSRLLDTKDNWIDSYQMSDMGRHSVDYWMYRNPPGNGSSPVLRRECLEDIKFVHRNEPGRYCYFDEDMRRAEDIELWIRILATSGWVAEGIEKVLTGYRVNPESLSADTDKQLEAWELTMRKVKQHSPWLVNKYYSLSKAYMLRYLSRRSIELGRPRKALVYLLQALINNLGIFKEWKITLYVVVTVALSNLLPYKLYKVIEKGLIELVGKMQRKRLA